MERDARLGNNQNEASANLNGNGAFEADQSGTDETTSSTALLYADVSANLMSHGAVEIPIPTGYVFEPTFSNYTSVHLYEHQGKTVEIYVWPNASNTDFIAAEEECDGKWVSADDFKTATCAPNNGKQCYWKQNGTTWVIVCCD